MFALFFANSSVASTAFSASGRLQSEPPRSSYDSGRDVNSDSDFYRSPNDSNVVLLMIDVSSTSDQISSQQNAAKTLVSVLPSRAQVAVLAYSTKQEIICDATADRSLIIECLDKTSSAKVRGKPGFTALFDSLSYAVDLFKEHVGIRSIVLFTDGADTGSKNATLTTTLRLIRDSGVIVFPVYPGCQCQEQNPILRTIEDENIGTLSNTVSRVVITNSFGFNQLRFGRGKASFGIENMQSLANVSGGRAFLSSTDESLLRSVSRVGVIIAHLVQVLSFEEMAAAESPLAGRGVKEMDCEDEAEDSNLRFLQRRIVKLQQAAKDKRLAESGVGGTVAVLISVDQQGRVTNARAISGHPVLRTLAEDAAGKLRLTELKICRKPIANSEVVQYGFQVSDHLNEEGGLRARAAGLELNALKLIKQGGNRNISEALKLLYAAQQIYEKVGDSYGQTSVFELSAGAYFRVGRSEEALDALRKALSQYESLNLLPDRAFVLQNISSIYSFTGDFGRALESLQEALRISREIGDLRLESELLKGMGSVYSAAGDGTRAMDSYLLSLEILFKNAGGSVLALPEDRINAASTLNHIGALYAELGEDRTALVYFRKALITDVVFENSIGEVALLNNIGLALFNLGDRERSGLLFKRALSLSSEKNYKQGMSAALNNLGSLYMELGNYTLAKNYYDESLPLNRQLGDKRKEARSLNNLGLVYALTDDKRAFELLHQSLPTQRLVGDKAGEAKTLRNLMWSWDRFGNRQIAIFFGKQAVNRYQELREATLGLEDSLRRSYLDRIEETYKELANLLISEGRLVEAEQVLQMLKEEEVFEYLRRDRSDASELSQRADLTPREAEALRRYNEIADRITELGREFGMLQDLVAKGIPLSPDQEQSYNDLSAKIEDASRAFQVFLRQLAEDFSRRPDADKEVRENLALQSELKNWGQGVVFVYTLVGEDRFQTILVTPETQTNHSSDIGAEDLNQKIATFREAVKDPMVDPRPLGKELYDLLIAPIEKDLKGAGAKTILWSLDGNLRLLPIGALWNGRKYFAEEYGNVVVTLASRTRLGDAVAPDWRALGLGVSKGATVTEPDGTREMSFNPLPAVPEELASIVRSENSPNGVLPGERLLDSGFSEYGLKRELLKGFKVIHIASHFSLNAGDSTKSFLLLGDGGVLTVDEIKNNPELRFNGVELLTLSACQTAVTGKDSTGKEIEGFGYVAQQKGAKAILASLWSVEDESTRLLMAEFYRLRTENRGMTKAEALQAAQLKMIRGEIKGSNIADARGVDKVKKSPGKAPPFTADPNAPYSHPYFWSPFVLIGNWR